MLPTSRDYLFSFFGILLAGGVPVPIYPPARPSQLEDHLRRHARILSNAQVVLLITVPEALTVARLLAAQVDHLEEVITPEALSTPGKAYQPVAVRPRDTAFMQYTSGSTGQPKGVVLTHADLLANIRAMGQAIEADSSDTFVSWLPLYHDMGLIGAWLGSLYYAMPLVLMSPLAFLTRPSRWLWTIHDHRATLSAAPNFAYELCLSKILESDIKGLDLSSWRMAFNGAEPVSPHTIRHFTERFASHGFRPETMAPVYGLAEAAVGLAFPPPGRGPVIDLIQRDTLLSTGKAFPATESDPRPLEYAACGQPLPGYQIRIVDPAGRELPERREGEIQFQGPSATSGYYRNPESNRQLFDGDWLNTGDLGYIAGGDLYLTSRTKDLIIRGGRNLYPYETEEAVGDIEGIRKGCVAMFGSTDPESGTERVILVAESRETEAAVLKSLRDQARATATELLGMPPDEIIIAPPHTVLKTSSGKVRRSAVRELYEQDKTGHRPRAVWWQLTRLALASLGPEWRRLWRRASDLSYAIYAHAIFWLLAPPVWLLVATVPGRHLRWRLMRNGARLLFRLAGVDIRVEGGERLTPGQACVLVANHSSYLDGVLLAAVLPVEMGFVAKAELARKLIPRRFLKRIGALFVERFDRQQSVTDAQHTTQRLQAGDSLLYFPEGTFGRAPGLLPFHMGAFMAAANAGSPLVPIIIRGTRSLLRGDSWFPHRGSVHIRVEAPILPEGSDWSAAIQLRNATRQTILLHLGEPDLAMEKPL
jgi:1-acyl-sn-glycerol-3-phosphate acyltransferase